MRWSLIALASLLLATVLLGCSTGVESRDVIGRWEQPKGPGKVVIEFEQDGTGEARLVTGEAQGGGSQATPLSWSLDGDRLTYTLSGGEVATEVLVVREADSEKLRVEAEDWGFIATGELTRSSQ